MAEYAKDDQPLPGMPTVKIYFVNDLDLREVSLVPYSPGDEKYGVYPITYNGEHEA